MGSGRLGRELDLEALMSSLEDHTDNIDVDFINNSTVTIQIKDDEPVYSIYRTGSFQIRGAETKENLHNAADLFRETLTKLGIDVPNFDFQHSNSVFIEDINLDMNLEVLSLSLGMENIEYEPEQFPGLIYRPQSHKATLLVFSSGKIIITGTTSRDVALSVINDLKSSFS